MILMECRQGGGRGGYVYSAGKWVWLQLLSADAFVTFIRQTGPASDVLSGNYFGQVLFTANPCHKTNPSLIR